MMKSSYLVASLVLLSACVSGSATPPPLPPPPPPAAPAPVADGATEPAPAPTLDDLVGHYRYSGGTEDEEARDAAVEKTVAEVFLLGRGIAREKILVACAIDDEIDIRREGDLFVIKLADRFLLKTGLSVPPVTIVGTDGDDLALTFEQRGAQLVQLAQGERGGTRRVFTPDGKGGMTLQVTIFAPRLAVPVDYLVHYRRVED
ncbi:MAG: hypothetical protein KC731_30865 [Myxococcales bacterium]|nr:hypothetical protein [Myxococcales bacterium]